MFSYNRKEIKLAEVRKGCFLFFLKFNTITPEYSAIRNINNEAIDHLSKTILKKNTMIKLFLIWVFAFSFFLNSHAQNSKYQSFRVTGKVEYKHNGKWRDLSSRVNLDKYDSLRIFRGSSLQILDKESNRVYKSNSAIRTRVKDFIENSNSNSKASLKRLNDAFLDRMKSSVGNSEDHSSVGTAMGASFRNSPIGESFEDSICSTIIYYANLACSSDSTFESNTLVANKVSDEDTYFLKIENQSSCSLCFNIISINVEDMSCQLLLSPGYQDKMPYIVLDAESTVTLDQFVFTRNDEVLLVIALPNFFDNEKLKNLLQDYKSTQGENLVPLIIQSIH